MKILVSKERSAISSILIVIGLMILLGGVSGVLLMGIMPTVKDYSQASTSDWLALMVSQGLSSLVMFVGAAWLYWYRIEDKTWDDFNWKAFPTWQILGFIVLLHFAFMPLNGFLAQFNADMKLPEDLAVLEKLMKAMEDELERITKFLTSFTSFWQFLLAFLVIAVIAGLGEELIFRGLIMRKIWRGTGNIHVAIWLSAIIFSAIHFQFYGFLPRVLLGALLGYVYYFTGNLAVPILLHIFNNGFIVFMLYLNNLHVFNIDVEKIDQNLPIPAIIASAIFSGLIIWRLKDSSKESQNTSI